MRNQRPAAPAGVYPRACGGTFPVVDQEQRLGGLSPRVRGNHRRVECARERHGSIPARAGEPRKPVVGCAIHGVYPRACGGTSLPQAGQELGFGLSPRVRGNRHDDQSDPLEMRSIPARAGEPLGKPSSPTAHTVYPRACGGTHELVNPLHPHSGLSPRVRGNRQARFWRRTPPGSIPARAGEPGAQSRQVEHIGVYPRACGGTGTPVRFPVPSLGLSPRVRGNQHRWLWSSP